MVSAPGYPTHRSLTAATRTARLPHYNNKPMTSNTTPKPTTDSAQGERAFELVGLYDDPENPEEFTVYPVDADGEQLTSRWISVAVEDTIDLDTMR